MSRKRHFAFKLHWISFQTSAVSLNRRNWAESNKGPVSVSFQLYPVTICVTIKERRRVQRPTAGRDDSIELSTSSAALHVRTKTSSLRDRKRKRNRETSKIVSMATVGPPRPCNIGRKTRETHFITRTGNERWPPIPPQGLCKSVKLKMRWKICRN